MVLPPDVTRVAQATERDAFIRQLPKRIAAIEDIWARLETGQWDGAQLEALYERVREIFESSKTFSLFQLNESAFSLEVYLSSFVGSDISPGPAQLDAVGGLVRTLKTAANVTASTEQELGAGSGRAAIHLLGEPDGLTAELATALRALDCDVEQFADPESLLAQLQRSPPKVIVADTATLPQMAPLSAELIRLRSHMSIDVPLIFISNSTALHLRVDAIRAGGDGYFVAPLDTAAVAAQVCEMTRPGEQRPSRVLVVEDDPTQADFAASILRKAGIDALQVTEPVKVIESLRAFQPDLILMDIYMPEVNGIELTTVIRDHKEFVAVPIVFLSGEQNADKQLDALSVGGDDFIAKPIRPKHLLGIVQTRIRRARQMLSATGQPAKHDRVTGLFSRQHFLDRLARLIDDQDRAKSAGVILIQPDELPMLQQKIGVGGVDHLMSELGEAIADQVGETDIAARIDEHSFGVLARRDSEQELFLLAERILHRIAGQDFPDRLRKTASIGLCFVDDDLDDANGIVKRAKKAAQAAAAHGGNRVHAHRPDTESREIVAAVQDDTGERVRAALQSDGFVIQYQPLLDLQSRGSENYEIVLRLENTQGDLTGGRELLDAAESAGLGKELDQWTIERAIDILKQRRDSGRRTRIFVHQSRLSALDPDLPAILLGRLRGRQMVGTGLVVDFCLSDLSRDLKAAQRNITGLHAMDVEVSLSRFPEKEAAFKVLRYLQAHYINIAPRLLKAEREVISSVIRQAHEASAKVIVSNVDDPRSIDLHWSSGADFLQGNFIQRPLENMDYDFSQVVI